MDTNRNEGTSHRKTSGSRFEANTSNVPFIKGATGNIVTEDAAVMLVQMDINTGINSAAVAQLSRVFEGFLGKKLPGKIKEIEQIVI